jgi:hypothetical protein
MAGFPRYFYGTTPVLFTGALFDLRQLTADLFVGRPLLVIHFDYFPAHDAFGIDHVRRRMGPAAAVGVEHAVAVDDFVVFVFEERKIELAVEAFAQHRAELFRLVACVGANGKDLDFLLLLFTE